MEKQNSKCKKSPGGEHDFIYPRMEESIDRDRYKTLADPYCKYCLKTQITITLNEGERMTKYKKHIILAQSAVNLLLSINPNDYDSRPFHEEIEILWGKVSSLASYINLDQKLKNSLINWYLKLWYEFGCYEYEYEVDVKIIKIIFTRIKLSKKQTISLISKIERDMGFQRKNFISLFESILSNLSYSISKPINAEHCNIVSASIEKAKQNEINIELNHSINNFCHSSNNDSHIGRH